jgi:hypothetical protein
VTRQRKNFLKNFFQIREAIETKITKRLKADQKTTGYSEKIEDLAESEKTQDNRLRNLEIELKNLKREKVNQLNFGEKEQTELVTACTAAIKNTEGMVFLLKNSNQFPLANSTGVANILHDEKVWTEQNTKEATDIFCTHLGNNTALLTLNYIKPFNGENTDLSVIKRLSDFLCEEEPTNRIKLEEMAAITIHALREIALEMTNPTGLSQTNLLPKILALKTMVVEIYGEDLEMIKHLKKCLRLLEQTRPNAGDIFDNLFKILPEGLNGEYSAIHRGMKCNQDQRFVEWGETKLKMGEIGHFADMNIFNGVSKEIYEKFRYDFEIKPIRQNQAENNAGKIISKK